MVNKVNGQKFNEYAKVSQQKRKSTESPEFHLDPEGQGVIYEKSQDKKKTTEAKETRGAKAADQAGKKAEAGVKIEISRQGREQSKQREQRADFSQRLRKLAQTAVDFLKMVWDKLWNDTLGEKEAEFPEVLQEQMQEAEESAQTGLSLFVEGAERLESPSDTSYTQEEIRAIFRRKDPKEIEDFLSDHGRRHLVKNSDLLTQYDKTGTIIGIDRSDKELILHGNKNEIKL